MSFCDANISSIFFPVNQKKKEKKSAFISCLRNHSFHLPYRVVNLTQIFKFFSVPSWEQLLVVDEMKPLFKVCTSAEGEKVFATLPDSSFVEKVVYILLIANNWSSSTENPQTTKTFP